MKTNKFYIETAVKDSVTNQEFRAELEIDRTELEKTLSKYGLRIVENEK